MSDQNITTPADAGVNIKHLEFIQAVITRHNSNSFMLKGWTLTITSALLALAGTAHEPYVVLIAIVPVLLFWGLDAFYLANERCFVDLYRAVATGGYTITQKDITGKDTDVDETPPARKTIAPYDMNFTVFKKKKKNKWRTVLRSDSIFWFYFPLLVMVVLIFGIFYCRMDCSI